MQRRSFREANTDGEELIKQLLCVSTYCTRSSYFRAVEEVSLSFFEKNICQVVLFLQKRKQKLYRKHQQMLLQDKCKFLSQLLLLDEYLYGMNRFFVSVGAEMYV